MIVLRKGHVDFGIFTAIEATVKVFRIKDTLKDTQRISAHKYRIVQGGEYSTPTLNMRKYRSLKKTPTLKCKYLTLYKPCTQRNPTKLDSIFFKMFLLIF
jgi:hypothetical protein